MRVKNSWNLELLYKGLKDPAIEADMKRIEKVCASFEKKYKGTPFTQNPKRLSLAYADYEKVAELLSAAKPWWYFELVKDLDSDNSEAAAMAIKMSQRLSQAGNKLTFFLLDIAKIPKKNQGTFLSHTLLAPYKYALTLIFKSAKHNLSEGEEQLENLLVQTSVSMWIESTQKMLNRLEVESGGRKMPVNEAIQLLASLPKDERRGLHQKINTALKGISETAENEINAIFNYKKIMDERRKYAKPYSATIEGYENDEKTVLNLASLVTKSFDISKRFYSLQAKIIGDKKITLADRGVRLGEIKTKFDFESSVQILKDALMAIDPEYASIFENYLANGQIDVFPKKGKKGGAYCWGMGSLPTFVMLNHTNDVNSLRTLAHEMGHAIHTEMSKSLPPRYRRYSTATAEVASTFFENIIQEEIEKRVTEEEKKILLHGSLMDDVATIFRQIACFNFEMELHQTIREKGSLSSEEMSAMLVKHIKSYVGESVDVSADDGYFFVYWSHIRRYFYVYTYAYGQIISRALFENWKKDKKYAGKIKSFLTSGGKMSPEMIWKSVGIDTAKTSFFEQGLKSIERDLDRLEKMLTK